MACQAWTLYSGSLSITAQVTYARGSQTSHGIAQASTDIFGVISTIAVNLDLEEYLTKVSGTVLTSYGRNASLPVRVGSLTFTTNKTSYGPYGVVTADSTFEVQGPFCALHGAVNRGGGTDVLSAVGFLKVSASRQAGGACDCECLLGPSPALRQDTSRYRPRPAESGSIRPSPRAISPQQA